MKTVAIETASSLAACVRRARLEPLIVMQSGRPVAALVPLSNSGVETATLATHPEFLAIIERSRTRQRTEGGLSPAEVRKLLGLPKRRRTVGKVRPPKRDARTPRSG